MGWVYPKALIADHSSVFAKRGTQRSLLNSFGIVAPGFTSTGQLTRQMCISANISVSHF